ncbi:MAG: DUF4276 family protein [Clostridiaceae bacterium]|nr:DUF4276 family protein [Clostridiaceae bacterium]
MILEVLCEDKSSVPVISQILHEISQKNSLINTVNIYPHRGKGKLPDDINQKPKPLASSLLDLLPAKIRAYDKVYQDKEIILVVVLDLDDQNPSKLYKNIEYVFRNESPNKYFVIGICIEEMEAWLLGDKVALLKAYPNADQKILAKYEQDSIGNTWEILAEVILGQKAESLIEVGYPAVGIYKSRWANKIAPFMTIDANKSPSFQEFISKINTVLAWAEEKFY